eukprot:TRINITY_DN18729_c0_g1_i1.p1 TRINITY_DN18729_c0_g1~~TRINITY_DN18729_c0_g1_i1.p1  ORF type:complete len:280 (+),score=42.74 TRINITY_DN18729_c0_g1_i1:82-840(+)
MCIRDSYPAGPPSLVVGGIGGMLPRQMMDQIRARAHNDVPVIIGRNTQESRFFDFLTGHSFSSFATEYRNQTALEAAVENVVKSTGYGGDMSAAVQTVLQQYPNGTNYDRYTALYSDSSFGCAAWGLAAELQAVQGGVWNYVYNYAPSSLQPWGAMHVAELMYVLNDTSVLDSHVMDAHEQTLVSRLQQAWVHMATYGRPDRDWPQDNNTQQRYLAIQGADVPWFRTDDNFRGAQLELWAKLRTYNLPSGQA